MTIFEKIKKNPEFKKHLEKLPPDERREIEESLRKLADQFEVHVLNPLEKLKP